MIRAIIFDCFGVIISDALQVIVEEVEATDPVVARQVVDIIHANNRGWLEPAESSGQIASILGISVQAFQSRISQGEIKNDAVLRYILELRQNYKTALLSNIGRQSLNRRFSKQELKKFFDAVIISGDIGMMKPEPEIYIYAAKQLDMLPSECLFIDDRKTHCNGAATTGMRTVVFHNLAQAKKAITELLSDPKN